MPDIATIGAAITSVKTAFEIAKLIGSSASSMEQAELKLKLAELMGALADAKMELVEVQDALIEKDAKIEELEKAFEEKGELTRQNDAYYAVDAGGNPTGKPYCLRCWESDHKKRQLVRFGGSKRFESICTACSQKYELTKTHEIT